MVDVPAKQSTSQKLLSVMEFWDGAGRPSQGRRNTSGAGATPPKTALACAVGPFAEVAPGIFPCRKAGAPPRGRRGVRWRRPNRHSSLSEYAAPVGFFLTVRAKSVAAPGHVAMARGSSIRTGLQLVVPDQVFVLELHSIHCMRNCASALEAVRIEAFPNSHLQHIECNVQRCEPIVMDRRATAHGGALSGLEQAARLERFEEPHPPQT